MKHVLFIFLLFIYMGNVIAQNPKKKKKAKDTREVVMYLGEVMIKANVLEQNLALKIDDKLKYAWYKNNMILSTKGGYDGRLLHGVYTEYHPNRNLSKKGQYDKGLHVGRWKEWYGNGEIKLICHWKRGQKHGKFIEFNNEGIKTNQGTYRSGEQRLPKAVKPKVEESKKIKQPKTNSTKAVDKKKNSNKNATQKAEPKSGKRDEKKK